LVFNFALENVISNVEDNQEGMQLNGKHQLLMCAAPVNILDEA
jgi:hypothetical protein